MSNTPPRRPLHTRSGSATNRTAGAIRLVPPEPVQLLGTENEDSIYARSPLPTHPSHLLLPGGQSRGYDFGHGDAKGSLSSVTRSPVSGAVSPGLSRPNASTTASREFQVSSASPPLTGFPVSTPHQPAKFGSPATRPLKKRLLIKDKKFSLVPHDTPDESSDPLSTNSSVSSLSTESRNLNGLCISNYDPNLSPSSPGAPLTPAPKSKISGDRLITVDHISALPTGEYNFVGGLRKVAKTPDKGKHPASDNPLPPLPPLVRRPDDLENPTHTLLPKPSFVSTRTTTSTSSGNSNYKVYRGLSPSTSDNALVPLSTSDLSYQVLSGSTPSYTDSVHAPPSTSDSNSPAPGSSPSNSSVIHRPHDAQFDEENYKLYEASSAGNSSIDTPERARQDSYSQESLIVQPLRARAKASNDNSGFNKPRSRESLHARTDSLNSISSVLSQQQAYQAAVVGSGSLIQLPALSANSREVGSWVDLSHQNNPTRSHMQEHPHVWSSQLSTVLSESEGSVAGTNADRASRSWSDGTRHSVISASPRQSGRQSHQSSHMNSIGSSLDQYEGSSSNRTYSDIIESPRQAYSRGGRQNSMPIDNQDEHGDGLTPLQDLRLRPSRTRLSALFTNSSSSGRTNTMRSSTSSRANSIISSSIPTWAKLYYGSGERHTLVPPGSSSGASRVSRDSRLNSFSSGSPNTEDFPLDLSSPRRRPRESQGIGGRRHRDSLEITPAPEIDAGGRPIVDFAPRQRTWSLLSSVWSPHLRRDRRAAKRNTIFAEAPSVAWSLEGNMFGRRNRFVVLFAAGFIFPFAWMIAALLPLPPKATLAMREHQGHSTESVEGENAGENNNNVMDDYEQHFGPMDEARYESAEWWRRLNRWMSVVGILLIAAVVVLAVLGVKQKWSN